MNTDPATDDLRPRLRAWLSAVASEQFATPPVPEGATVEDIVGALHERETQHLGEAKALMAMTGAVSRRVGDLQTTLRMLTELCARTIGVERVSVWRCTCGFDAIRCLDLHELAAGRHSEGTELRAEAFPAYFEAMRSADILDADDAHHDPRTREFTESYLKPLGIGAMMDAGIHVGGALAGVICFEHVGPSRRWTTGEKAFALAVANLVSLLLETIERDRARAALRVSEQRFRSVARAVTDTIWDWDLVTDAVWWNDGIETQFGYAPADLPETSESRTESIHDDDRERVMREIDRALRGDGDHWVDEYRFLHRDGRIVHVQDTGVIIRDDSGRAIRMIGGMIDITARRTAEAELVRARQLAEEASRVKTEFLANMSHEMRTPLTAVLGFSDLLMHPTLAASDRLDYVQSIRRNGAHLLALIDDVLDLSSMEAKVANLQRTDCSLHRIINEVTSMMQVRASYKGLRFSLTYETPIPATVQGDPGRIRQILLNLIGNAIKFTDAGEVRVVARLRLGGKDASAVEIDIVDTGIGIDADDLPKVFQPFWQANASAVRRHGGSGLGLPICLPLARAMGGDIQMKSQSGVGSVFMLRLPHAMDSTARMVRHPGEDLPAPAAEASEEHHDAAETNGGSDARSSTAMAPATTGRILLAEDGADNQLLISTMLRRHGHEVTVVDNGVDAVERALIAAASGRPFHVILMDMQMPRLDGYGATALLRSRGYARPVFALTAHAMPEERKRCLVAGCDEFLSKPVTWPLLLSTIDSYLKRQQAGDAMETELSQTGEHNRCADERMPIHSTLADDPDMAELVEGFVERLPGQVIEIRDAARSGDRDRLRRLAHQLKGAGGSYGFDAVSDSAAELEKAASAGADPALMERRVGEFESVCGRVRAGAGGGQDHD